MQRGKTIESGGSVFSFKLDRYPVLAYTNALCSYVESDQALKFEQKDELETLLEKIHTVHIRSTC